MDELKIYDAITHTEITELYQYDSAIKFYTYLDDIYKYNSSDTPEKIDIVTYPKLVTCTVSSMNDSLAYTMDVEIEKVDEGNRVISTIPKILLEKYGSVIVYITIQEFGNNKKTNYRTLYTSFKIPVRKRNKPTDYISDDTDYSDLNITADYTELKNLPYTLITADMVNNGKLDLINLSTGAYQLLTGAKIICSENTVIDDLDVELIAGSLLFISDYDVSSNTHNLSYHGDTYSGFIGNYEHYTMPEYDNNPITSGLISESNPTLYMSGSDVCNDLLSKQDAKNIVYSIDDTSYRIILKTTDFYSTDTHRINEYRFQKILSKLTFSVPTSGAGNNGYLDSEIGFDIKFISGATATSIVQTANPKVEIYWYGDDTIAETTSNTTTSLFQPQPNKFYHVKIRREVIGWVCEVKSVDYIPTTENEA